MPWECTKTVEEKREEFVRRVLAREATMAALCREYEISRPTGYKWLQRYKEGLPLTDQGRRPFHTPNKISPEMEHAIIAMRQAEPAIGAVKIHRMLKNNGVQELPCVKTVNNVLKRNQLITAEASAAATPYVRYQRDKPNDLWQLDFKGHYALQNGQRCHPLSVIDDCSRFCLCADAKDNERLPDTKASLTATFKTYGLPFSILCDNGNPWGASQSSGITKFEVWLMDQGVLTIHSSRNHPQTQGKVERFNGSFKRERLKFYVPKDMEDAQAQRLEYQNFYNNTRPHAALNLDTPAEHYTPSSRPYLDQIPRWDYEPGGERRLIRSSGYLTFKGHGYFLSEGIAEKEVFLYPSTKNEDEFKIVYRQFVVGRLNVRELVITSRRIYLQHNDPRSQQ